MSELSIVRSDVAAELAAQGLNAVYTVPDRVVPPVAVVQPGEPYLTAANHANSIWEVTLRVTVLTGAGSNETQMNDLDDAIEKVILGLRQTQWNITVGEPYALVNGATEYPAVDITITNYLEIN